MTIHASETYRQILLKLQSFYHSECLGRMRLRSDRGAERRFTDGVKEDVKSVGVREDEEAAEDRFKWRHVIGHP